MIVPIIVCRLIHNVNLIYFDRVQLHKLAEVLEKKKLSKRQFAKLLKVEYANVFRFFRAGYDPKLSTLLKWAKALGVKAKDLISDE